MIVDWNLLILQKKKKNDQDLKTYYVKEMLRQSTNNTCTTPCRVQINLELSRNSFVDKQKWKDAYKEKYFQKFPQLGFVDSRSKFI